MDKRSAHVAAASTTQKQKTVSIIDQDSNLKAAKIRKIDEQTSRRSQLSETHRQTREEDVPFTQVTDDPAACKDELDRLTEIWNHASQSQTPLFNCQDEFRETKEQLAQADAKIEKIQTDFREAEEENEAMAKYIESKIKMQDEIIEKQNVARSLVSLIDEHTNVVTDTLTGCVRIGEYLRELYNNVNLKQQEKIEVLTQRKDQVISEKRELTEQLELKNKKLRLLQIRCQQLENEVKQITQRIRKLNCKREECERLIRENQEKYNNEIKKLTDNIKNVEANLNDERQANSKLIAANKESSIKVEELCAKHKVLQVTVEDQQQQVNHLQLSIEDRNQTEANLNKELHELKTTNIEIISNKELQLAAYRKELQILMLAHTDATNKLSEVIEKNEDLSNTAAKTVAEVKELKEELQNKDDEIRKLSTSLNSILAENNNLSQDIQKLNEELIIRREQICQARADFENSKAKEGKTISRGTELKTKVAAIQQELENKIVEMVNLLRESNDEKIKYSEEIKKFEHDIDQQARQIDDLRKRKGILQREREDKEAEFNREMQQVTHSLKQCQLAEHEEHIKEQSRKIDILNEELSAEKLKLTQKNLEKTETDRKDQEKRTLQLKEMQCNLHDLNEKLLVMKKANEDLRIKLENIQASDEAAKQLELHSRNLSPLIGITYAQHQTIRSASTPEHNSYHSQRIQFDMGSSSDLSSINGLEMFDEAERRYKEFTRSNRTDSAKLSQTKEIEISQVPLPVPIVKTAPVRGKFFKNYGMRNKKE